METIFLSLVMVAIALFGISNNAYAGFNCVSNGSTCNITVTFTDSCNYTFNFTIPPGGSACGTSALRNSPICKAGVLMALISIQNLQMSFQNLFLFAGELYFLTTAKVDLSQ